MHPTDDEIRDVEMRIARERAAVTGLLADYRETTRDIVTAPRSLIAFAALGYFIGEVLHSKPRAAAPRRRGFTTALLGTAVALLRAQYGSPWALLAQQLQPRTPGARSRAQAKPR